MQMQGIELANATNTTNTTNRIAATDTGNESIQIAQSVQKVKERMELEGYTPTIQEKTVISAIEQANKRLDGSGREFEFSVHEKTKQIMVKVMNTETKEVIREIPSEKILDMVAAMCEQAGLFVDEKR